MSGQRHTPEAEARWAQSRSRCFGSGKNPMCLPRFEFWIVQAIAQSLHRLHLIGSQLSVLVSLFVTRLKQTALQEQTLPTYRQRRTEVQEKRQRNT